MITKQAQGTSLRPMRSQREKGKGGKEIFFHDSSIWEQPMTAKEEGAPCRHLGSSWSFVSCLTPYSPQTPEPQEVTFKRDAGPHPCPIFKAPGVSFMLTEQSKKASVWHSMSVPNLLSLTPHHELPLPAHRKAHHSQNAPGRSKTGPLHVLAPTQKAHLVLLSL